MAKHLTAEERKRQRELEEARKAGLAAPELDEEGKLALLGRLWAAKARGRAGGARGAAVCQGGGRK